MCCWLWQKKRKKRKKKTTRKEKRTHFSNTPSKITHEPDANFSGGGCEAMCEAGTSSTRTSSPPQQPKQNRSKTSRSWHLTTKSKTGATSSCWEARRKEVMYPPFQHAARHGSSHKRRTHLRIGRARRSLLAATFLHCFPFPSRLSAPMEKANYKNDAWQG